MVCRSLSVPGRPMATLRRIQAASVRVAPHWFLCVFIGAYVAVQIAAPSIPVS